MFYKINMAEIIFDEFKKQQPNPFNYLNEKTLIEKNLEKTFSPEQAELFDKYKKLKEITVEEQLKDLINFMLTFNASLFLNK